jgi:hypothetical protein
MTVEVSLKHIPKRAQMCFDAATEGVTGRLLGPARRCPTHSVSSPLLRTEAIGAAAAWHHFQTLDFLTHGFVEDGVGQEDQPARAGVGVVVLTPSAWTEYARLFSVHSEPPSSVGRAPGCCTTRGATPLSDTIIIHAYVP